jgi:hypothetical protein
MLRILSDLLNWQTDQLIYFDYDEPGCSKIKLFTLRETRLTPKIPFSLRWWSVATMLQTAMVIEF